MPQIYVLLNTPRAKSLYCPGESLDAYFHRLISIVAKHLGTDRKKVTLTVVEPRRTANETDIKVEVRFLSGGFDFPRGSQEILIDAIAEEFKTTAEYTTAAPRITLSVWCKPYCGGSFKTFEW
jgi:hypothetical protein